MSDVNYHVTMQMRSNWQVGYSPERDEMFLYFIDQDDLVWVFWRGGLDACGFYEYMNMDKAILLGDL